MNAKGIKELKRYQSGDKLTPRQSIIAKCAECMGFYADGKADCALDDCPLYPLMPYGRLWKHREKGIIPVGLAKHRLQKQKRV